MGKKQVKEDAPETMRVHNRREGAISLGNWTGLEFPPGVSFHSMSVLEGLPKGTKDSLKGLVEDGVLHFGPEPEPEPEPSAAPAPAELPPTFQPLPADEALALLAIETESSHAVLSAWFDRTTDRPAVSDAILARLSKLDNA